MIRRVPHLLLALARSSLVEKVERDHRQTDHAFRRRRIAVAITLVVGATVLGFSLAVRPGDSLFYLLTAVLAATWVLGSFASGPLHLGRIEFRRALRRPVLPPILLGLAAGAVFILGALVVREVPLLRQFTENVLAHARYGSLPLVAVITIVNGVAEEIFFRGALFAAIGVRHPVAISTVIYGLATIATGNPMLVLAACTLGVVLGLERRASGGVLAPILTHVTWSAVMLFALPPIFAAA
jgi:membrane protease YdiL (CAAX protease family)